MAFRTPDPELANQATLYLIVGGLFMLGVVLFLVLLRSILVPRRTTSLADAQVPPGRRMAPVPVRGTTQLPAPPPMANVLHVPLRRPGRAKPRSLDDIVEAAAEEKVGLLRYLKLAPDRTLVRAYACQDCAQGNDRPCADVGEFLHRAFGEVKGSLQVREVKCGPGAVCDFEVRH